MLLDPIGNVPMFIATVEKVAPERRLFLIARECFFAYLILVAFALAGNRIMGWMQLSDHALGISGGVILFIIALRMIFRRPEGVFGETLDGEPLIFPLAIPLFAGPSAITFVLLMTSKAPDQLPIWLLAITLASAVSTAILSMGSYLDRFLGKRGLRAMETLIGLLLTAVATQMLLDGVQLYLEHIERLPG